MHSFVGRAIAGAVFTAACLGASPAWAEPVREVYDPAQIRRVAASLPEAAIARVEVARADPLNPLLRLVGTNGAEVFVQGTKCEAADCRVARFVGVSTPPSGMNRQDLADRHNEKPHWAVAIFNEGTLALRGELLFAGGITDANLAQYIRSIVQQTAQLSAGRP